MAAYDPKTGRVVEWSGMALRVDQIQNSDGTIMVDGSLIAVDPGVAVVELTDSTGLEPTHDDTLAETAVVVTLTDSTGLSGSHNDTLAATTVPADLTGGQSPTETEHNDLLTVVRVMAQNDSDMAQKIIELVALVNIISQNQSDVAQKVNEIISSLTDASILDT